MSRKVFFSLFFTSGVFICGRAGFWQLRRKKWKEDLLETRSKHLGDAPMQVSFPLQESDLNFRPAEIKGRFDHSKEMLLMRKHGELSGYRVITPLFVKKDTGILVNRGWIPLEYKELGTRQERNEEVLVSGVIREGESPGKFTPPNNPLFKEWYFIDLDGMSSHSGLSNPESKQYLIQEINWERQRELNEEEDFYELPVRSVKNELMHWYVMPYTHASYAAFWFATSAICLVFNIIVLKKL